MSVDRTWESQMGAPTSPSLDKKVPEPVPHGATGVVETCRRKDLKLC